MMTSYLGIVATSGCKGGSDFIRYQRDQKSLSDRGLSKAIFRAQKQCDPILCLIIDLYQAQKE